MKTIVFISGEMQCDEREVDEFDANERSDKAADAVNEKIADKNLSGADGAIFHAGEREGNERNDDESVEDDCAQNCAFGRMQPHDVERGKRSGLCARCRVK